MDEGALSEGEPPKSDSLANTGNKTGDSFDAKLQVPKKPVSLKKNKKKKRERSGPAGELIHDWNGTLPHLDSLLVERETSAVRGTVLLFVQAYVALCFF